MNISPISIIQVQPSIKKNLSVNYSDKNTNKTDLSFTGARSIIENKALHEKLLGILFPQKTKLYEKINLTPTQLKNEVESLTENGLKMLDDILAFREHSKVRIEEVLKEHNAETLGSSWSERVKGLNYGKRDEIYNQAIRNNFNSNKFTGTKYPDLEFEVNYYRGEFLEQPYPYISRFKDNNNIQVIGGDGKDTLITKNAEFNISDLFDKARFKIYPNEQNKPFAFTEYTINHATKKVESINQNLGKKLPDNSDTYNMNILFNNNGKATRVIFRNSMAEPILSYYL